MSILDRDALGKPAGRPSRAASELSIDGYRRLRKADLIDAILARQGGRGPAPRSQPPRTVPRNGRPAGAGEADRGGRGRRPRATRTLRKQTRAEAGRRAKTSAREEEAREDEEDAAPGRPTRRWCRRRRQRGRGRGGPSRRPRSRRRRSSAPSDASGAAASARRRSSRARSSCWPTARASCASTRPNPPRTTCTSRPRRSSAASSCPGDRIAGPRRAPRRSERFASLVRIDTINGRPAEEVADSTRFDDLPAAFPTERFRLGSDDPTIKAIEWLTPFGQGSRVTIVGPARAGKTEALRRLAATLAGLEEVQVSLVLAGVRPEEISEWQQGPVAPTASVSFAASADAQAQTLERVVDQARRLAARGAHAVVLIDTLSGTPSRTPRASSWPRHEHRRRRLADRDRHRVRAAGRRDDRDRA